MAKRFDSQSKTERLVEEWVTQSTVCKNRQLAKAFRHLPKCLVCESPNGQGPQGSCRFSGFRRVLVSPEGRTLQVDFGDHAPEAPFFAHSFNQVPTSDAIRRIMEACAGVLLPVLERELEHMSRPRVLHLHQQIQYRRTCDICVSELFTGGWLCESCGIEVCSSCSIEINSTTAQSAVRSHRGCSSEPDKIHSHATLRPISRIQQEEVETAVVLMKALRRTATTTPQASTSILANRSAAQVYKTGSLSRSQFSEVWKLGEPLVITGVQKRLQGHWGPDYFVQNYGLLKVTPIYCEDANLSTSRDCVADFFGRLSGILPTKGVQKLKDWPPTKDFREQFPDLYNAFFTSLPIELQNYACPNGISNLSAHFPTKALAPDLGPKMYIAMASSSDSYGSTMLHLDVTDAINLMVWSKDSSDVAAIWHIFSAESASTLRTFMRAEFSLTGDIDPIHQQTYYLPDRLLMRLREEYGVSPWTIHQGTGDVILIPAGCAHQVRNVSNAIKIACDFVSHQNLSRTVTLAEQLRTHRINTSSGDDVLQLDTLLWYAWNSVVSFDKQHGQITANLLHDAPSSSGGVLAARTKRRRNQDKRARKKAKATPRSDHNFACPQPNCLRLGAMYHRGGLLDHLKEMHPEGYKKVEHVNRELRQPTVYSDAAFSAKLMDFLGIPEGTKTFLGHAVDFAGVRGVGDMAPR